MSRHSPGGARRERNRLHPRDPEPEPDRPDVPRPQVPPDLAVQLSSCLDDLPLVDQGGGDKIREDIVGQLRQALSDAGVSDADVRTACVDGTERIGLWLDPLDAGELGDQYLEWDQRRDEALADLVVLAGGEDIAYRVGLSFARGLARRKWADIAKRYDSDGNADPDGPLRLRYLRIKFPKADLVTTTIGAQYRKIKFRIRVDDTVSLAATADNTARKLPTCATTAKVRPKGKSWLLTTLKGLWWVLFPRRDIDVTSEAEEHGAGCQIVDQLPEQFLVPGTELKLELSYERLALSDDRLDAAASWKSEGREPQVAIHGLSQVTALTPTARFTAHARDLRAPTFTWSADGDVGAVRGEETTVMFLSRPGSYQVRLTATDADGASVSAAHEVRVVGAPDGGGDDRRRPGDPPGGGRRSKRVAGDEVHQRR